MSNTDETETIRRAQQAELNASAAKDRAEAEAKYGKVWNTDELQKDFSVLGFMAPYVVVRRDSDGVKGSLQFTHNPRWYFNFSPE